MIRIGLAGWGDHDSLYADFVKPREKLSVYSRHFSVVEVDSSFYAVLADKSFAGWVQQTPPDFAFIVKAYQGMTGHLRGKNPFANEQLMFEAFNQSITPAIEAGKLKAVLFQYPPWFDCTKDNVKVLRQARARMKDIPVALEFRHQSWFTADMLPKTLAFMEQEGWIHSICDEPQAGPGSVPTVLEPVNNSLTIVRMHGRNVSGWNQGGAANWREVRYLYDYNHDELAAWKTNLEKLETQCGEVCVIFNNNSGGHAAGNAKELMALLGMQLKEIDGEQLKLFE